MVDGTVYGRQVTAFDSLCATPATPAVDAAMAATGPDTIEYKIAEVFTELRSKFRSGYILRDVSELPRQGRSGPWRVTHAYEVDKTLLLNESIDDGALEFVRRG